MAKASAVTLLEFDKEAILARELEVAQESDEEIIARLDARFAVLTEMTKAVKAGEIRAMIVSGPPGVGKSYGVEEVLSKDDLFNALGDRKPRYEIVRGAMSAIGLYGKLYEFSDKNSVLVFDDADNIFYDQVSLNILKAALDSSPKRYINWNTDSRLLRSEGIPNRFEFKGSVIFISNIKFAHVRSKVLKDHLDALESRCHYIDLEIDTNKEKLLRIKQLVTEGMLDRYEFDEPEIATNEIVDYIIESQDLLRELSLRIVLKMADLRKSFPTSWKAMARTTLMRRS